MLRTRIIIDLSLTFIHYSRLDVSNDVMMVMRRVSNDVMMVMRRINSRLDVSNDVMMVMRRIISRLL